MTEQDPKNISEDELRARTRDKYLEWLAASPEERAKVMAAVDKAFADITEGRLRLLERSSTYNRLCALTWSSDTGSAPGHAHSSAEGFLAQQPDFDGSDPDSQADNLFTAVMNAPRIGELPKEGVINPANSFQNRWRRACAARDISHLIESYLAANPGKNLSALDLHGASFIAPHDLAFTPSVLKLEGFDEYIIGGFIDHLITAQRKFVVHTIDDENLLATLLSEGNRFCAETRSPLFAPPERILICVGSEELKTPGSIEARLRTVGLLLPRDLPSGKPEVQLVDKIPWEAFS